MNLEEKNIEKNKYVLDKQNEWIVNADNKISVAFGVFSIMFTILGYISLNNILDYNITNKECICLFVICIILLTLGLLSFVLSLVFYFIILYPNLSGTSKYSKKNLKEKRISIIYFDDIAQFGDAEDFIEYARDINDECFNNQLLEEVYYNAKICSRKMRLFRIGLVLSILGFSLSFLSCIIGLFI